MDALNLLSLKLKKFQWPKLILKDSNATASNIMFRTLLRLFITT